MQVADDEERRMVRPVSEYMDDGVHADVVCGRYGLTREELAQWCNWMDFRSTWVDPFRQPPVPNPAPDYAPDKRRETSGDALPNGVARSQ